MGGGGRVGGGGGGGGQGGCEWRSEAFVNIQKKKRSDQGLGWWGSMVWGRWVMWGMGDVNQE